MSVKLFFPCHKCYKNGQSLCSKEKYYFSNPTVLDLGGKCYNNLFVTLFFKKGTTFKNFNSGLILASPHNDYVTI